jgi:hypothetical protein
MKKLFFLSFFLLTFYASFSQKPTGGCGIEFGGFEVGPCDKPNQLYVGENYYLLAHIYMTGCEQPIGYYEVMVDSKVIGTSDGRDGETAILLDRITLPPGSYTLTICYHNEDISCKQTLCAYHTVAVLDKNVKAQPNGRPETAKSPSVPSPGKDELSLYPNPAGSSFCIDGLKASETAYELNVMDQQGRQVYLNDSHRA